MSLIVFLHFCYCSSHLKCESVTGEAGLVHCATHTLSAITIPVVRYVRVYFNLQQDRRKDRSQRELKIVRVCDKVRAGVIQC